MAAPIDKSLPIGKLVFEKSSFKNEKSKHEEFIEDHHFNYVVCWQNNKHTSTCLLLAGQIQCKKGGGDLILTKNAVFTPQSTDSPVCLENFEGLASTRYNPGFLP